jgi:RNase P protein component
MPDGQNPNGPNYDDDFYAWTQYQAEVLRSMPTTDNRFDRKHVAEEIEDLGKSERDAVRSQVRRILEHLLKLAHSSAKDPRSDWVVSVASARAELDDKLTATLRQDLEAELPRLYRRARKIAGLALASHGESNVAAAFPSTCPYSIDQILDDDWYPEPPAQEEGA